MSTEPPSTNVVRRAYLEGHAFFIPWAKTALPAVWSIIDTIESNEHYVQCNWILARHENESQNGEMRSTLWYTAL